MESIKKHIVSYRFFTLPVLCLCSSLVTLPQTSCAPTTPKPTQNITVTVPEGTQSHGNPNLLCTPARWTDVAIFFFANYVAHAVTTKSLPGETALATLRTQVTALIFPLAGILRGIEAIRQLAILSDTPLDTAAKAEALCVVIRSPEWQPKRGDVACVSEFHFPKRTGPGAQSRIDTEEAFRWPYFCIEANDRSFLPANNNIAEFNGRKVHGICCLPHGYALAVLPPRVRITELCKDRRDGLEVTYISPWNKRMKDAFKTLKICCIPCSLATEDIKPPMVPRSQDDDSSKPDTIPTIELSSNYNLPKCVIAVFQTLYASATLYQTRGDQIQRYGYAAFGLTVTPYLLMSIVNLLSTMLTPDYQCLYLVRSEIMDEAARRVGARFEGMVATLRSDARKVRHYVEFTIDEHDSIFIRNPTESISQRGLHDATDVTQRQIRSEYAVFSRNSRKLQVKERAQSLFRVVISESPGFSDNLAAPNILNRSMKAGLIIGFSPIAIIGGLSHFNAGHSTIAQRVWTMSWLAFGWYIGFFLHTARETGKSMFAIMFYASPAIGGFVVVAQMLMSYGRCIEIGKAHI